MSTKTLINNIRYNQLAIADGEDCGEEHDCPECGAPLINQAFRRNKVHLVCTECDYEYYSHEDI